MKNLSDPLSRRGFLAASSLVATGSLVAQSRAALGIPARPASTRIASNAGQAKNLIFMVSDGMSAGTLGLTDHYVRITTGKSTAWTRLTRKGPVRRSLSSTHCADSLVTDSAAASSAWSTGVKHNSGSICVDPAGKRLTPFLLRAQQSGKRVGVATTTTVTHATPAGFYANVPQRGSERDIATQWLERPIDVALGGGAGFFNPDAVARTTGVNFVRTREALAAAKPVKGGRLLGLFNDSQVSYTVERAPTEPSLKEMAAAAIAHLADSPSGYVLQIEGGRVDHAAHNNDAFALLHEQLDFDAALEMVAEYVQGRDDTLLIVTTDHGTANPGLTSYGKDGNEGLKLLGKARHSFDWINKEHGRLGAGVSMDVTVKDMVSVIRDATTVELSSEEIAYLRRALEGERADAFMARAQRVCILGSLLANHCGVSFVSPNHTADHVELFAMGAGYDTLPAFLDNIEVYDWAIRMLDLAPAKPI